ncbi:MAG: hypothetical protein COA85_02005 [Robiginitomaculum sp.]|nr:MAG: hypothetical protein COA85_02005 [Robiginitomaculum sp.]
MQAKREASSEANVSKIEQDQVDRKMAGLWTWPMPEREAVADKTPAARSIPETLARVPMHSGRRLVKCLEGVEGQIWGDGSLVASRWWPDVPNQKQWVVFLRSARLKTNEISLSPPHLEEVPWRANLSFVDSAVDAARTYATPMRLFIATSMLLVSLTLYAGMQYLHYTRTLQNLHSQIAARKEIVSDVLVQRNKAIQNLQVINHIANFGKPTALLAGLAGGLGKVQGDDMSLVRITLRDNQLRLRLKGKSDINGAALVKLLENDPALESVSVVSNPNKIIEISAKLATKEKK